MIFVVYTKETQIIMKKSKIIVPALGLLVLSTAASVSGTVAWFTANRTYNTSINNIAVVSTTGSLKGTFEAGVGTSISDGSSISVASQTVLTHGSFNHSTKLASWPTDDAATKFGSYTLAELVADDASTYATHVTTDATANNLLRLTDAASNKVYSALTFRLTLTYTTSNVSDTYALFLNLDAGKSNVGHTTNTAGTTTTTDPGYGKETYKGFRLAFIGASETVVWAANETTAECDYIESVAAGVGAEKGGYTAGDLIASDTAAANIAALSGSGSVEDGIAAGDADDYYNYLGTFAIPGSGTERKLSFLCVAWFEGTDPNVVTGAALDSVTANMFFETRRLG